MFQPLEEENLDGGTEEAIPLGIQFLGEDRSISDWIQQNITKLSSEFGVNFKGCEEKAKELLMKIDSNKQGNREVQSKQTTGKRKGLLELKRLQLDSKFYSNGTRRGKGVLSGNMIRTWKANVVCFQETKWREIANKVKEMRGSRWAITCNFEASGTRGGIVIMWDKRRWVGEVSSVGAFWFCLCLRPMIERKGRNLVGARGKRSIHGPLGPMWDFNTVRYPSRSTSRGESSLGEKGQTLHGGKASRFRSLKNGIQIWEH
ncbi:hypothetical protein H5410_061310 [Solanum commersonii]|uniref:Uncharacterized protein n=1 Tax=Solanum commersonii TaxID=4109 RepID=A0A9J5W8R8_SOLCO|nr:hypothetical protein H5410_061310 [Solanum commersonii]